MLKNYIFALFFLLFTQAIAAKDLANLTPKDLNNEQGKKALIIDIRTLQEWKTTGLIPGSYPVNFFDARGKYDAEQWLASVKKLQSNPDQEIILVCHSGSRSGRVGQFLIQQLNLSHVAHLSRGISSWLKEKRPTQSLCSATQTC